MAEFSDKPGYAFSRGAPPEVDRYFDGKSLQPSFSWRDVEPEEHAVVFSVAKAMKVDVLEAIQEELRRAAAEGLPFEAFKKELTPRLKALGWWGEREVIDPATGERLLARLGSPRRLRTIWRSNMRAARAAGQWDRIQRSKEALPYLVYLLGPSRRHRVEHQAKQGLVYPVDHPFWERWYPPNGWNCKCHVRQITREEAEERGVSKEPFIETRRVRNRRTGEEREVPRGIDVGWDRNPGKLREENAAAFLAGKLDAASPAFARAAAVDMARSWRAQRIHEGSAPGQVPVAMLSREAADRLGAKTRVVRYSAETAAKERAKHGEAVLDVLAETQSAFDGPDVFRDESGTVAFRSISGKVWRIVAKATQDGEEIYVTSFHRSNESQLERWRRAGGSPSRK